jgi:hypothetical protein
MNTLDPQRAGREDGERRKDAAHDLLEARRDILIRRARRALLTHLLDADTATADDVAALIGPTPDGIDPRFLGTVPGPLARAGIIRRVGFDPSARPSRNASILSRWELADRAAAVAWLDTHPDLPDPENEDDGEGMPCLAPLTPPPSNLSASQALLF